MTTFVDTNVLIDVLEPGAEHHEWSKGALEAAKSGGPVFVSDAVYSEFTVSMDSVDAANEVLQRLALVRCSYSDPVLFKAGKAYAAYRKNQGPKLNVLPDFFIGALAADEEAPLVTRDPGKVRTYFPDVELITP
jgi:predicted nucleic acid-binding protein